MPDDPQKHITPQEPDKYSLDEMMQRLRSRGIDSEPELVTRADGTQAYRVKKRKRRTRQPHKIKQQRRHKVLVLQIGALVVLAMLLVTAAVGLFAYYNSSGFVGKLRGQIAKWTGAQIEFDQFRMTPVSASALTATMHWPEGSPLHELKLEQLSADLKITSFVSSHWTGEEVMALRGILQLRSAPAGSAPAPSEAGGDSAFPFSFIRYRCENLTTYFGVPGKAPMKCRDMEVSFYRLPDADQLRISNGSITARGWPELPIERGLIEFQDARLSISSLRIGTGSDKDGFANIEGTIDPRSTNPVFLDVTLENLPFHLIGGKNLSHLIEMRVDSKAKLSFVPGRFDSYELSAPFDEGSSSKGVFIGGFPFLDILNQQFNDEVSGNRHAFGERPFTTEATGVLHRNAEGISLRNLRLTEKNFFALRGEIRIDRTKKISGHFDIGIPERFAGSHPSPVFETVFDRDEDGFRWTKIQISGTVHKPNDDFSEKIRKAAETGADKTAPNTRNGETPLKNRDLERKFRDLIDGKQGQ